MLVRRYHSTPRPSFDARGLGLAQRMRWLIRRAVSSDAPTQRMRTDRQVTQPSSFSNSLMSTVITR